LMLTLKNPDEIKIMAEAGRLAGEVLEQVMAAVKPGVSTLELDQLAENLIQKVGGESGFKKVDGYYHTICTTPNEQVVHGIPNDKKLKDGDILSVDLGVFYNGFHSDTAVTVPVGEVSTEIKRFLATGQRALYEGIKQARFGNRVGDISTVIEKILRQENYGIVRSLTGHGVGRELHEEPLIPNFGKSGTGEELKEGLVIAIEPIYTNGSPEVYLEDDGWTLTSEDATLAGLFEHTVAITKTGPQVLTKRPHENIP
jgi:methionyl aminopeptidase